MTNLMLVRHGQTDWNTTGKIQGQTDILLNETGRQQAEAVARRLSELKFDAVYASDLQRAWQTAQAILQYHPLAARPEPRLRELHFGDWSGLTFAEIQAINPKALANWQAELPTVAPPGGETLNQMAARVKAVYQEILNAHADQNVLIVTHGGPIQVMLCQMLGHSIKTYWQFHLSNASVTKVSIYPEGTILNLLNDTCHLENHQA
jgi:alpha-ribazole phosphatase